MSHPEEPTKYIADSPEYKELIRQCVKKVNDFNRELIEMAWDFHHAYCETPHGPCAEEFIATVGRDLADEIDKNAMQRRANLN